MVRPHWRTLEKGPDKQHAGVTRQHDSPAKLKHPRSFVAHENHSECFPPAQKALPLMQKNTPPSHTESTPCINHPECFLHVIIIVIWAC